mgnify:CR=1 FL=1
MILHFVISILLVLDIVAKCYDEIKLEKEKEELKKTKIKLRFEEEEKYSKEHYAELKRQIIKDYNELTNAFLDRGYELINVDIEKMPEGSAVFALINSAIIKTRLDSFVEEWNANPKDNFVFEVERPLDKFVLEVRRLTEEEKMQRKLLKEMGIEE